MHWQCTLCGAQSGGPGCVLAGHHFHDIYSLPPLPQLSQVSTSICKVLYKGATHCTCATPCKQLMHVTPLRPWILTIGSFKVKMFWPIIVTTPLIYLQFTRLSVT